LIGWNSSSRRHWMLSVRLKHAEYASLVTVVHRCHLKPLWLSGGVGVWNAAEYALVVKATKKTFVDVAVTLTDSSMSSDGSSSCIGQCVNATLTSAVRKLLHNDNQSARIDDDVSFCNMFANYFVSKIDSLKVAITSQLIDIAPPPPLDLVSSLPSLQLLESVTSFEVSKLLSIIPPTFWCSDYIATAIIKQCSPVFSDLIAYMANLSFSQGTFPSKFMHASLTPLLKKARLAWIHLSPLIFDLCPTSITSPEFLKAFSYTFATTYCSFT